MWKLSSTALWIAWRTFRGIRIGVAFIATILLFAAVANIVGYRLAYPTAADRLRFAPSLASNVSLRLFYGIPYDVTRVGGYLAWRLGGIAAIIVSAWGVFATIGVLRGEEEAGRWELLLAGRIGRAGVLISALVAVMVGVVVMWLATTAAILAVGWSHGDMALGECLYLALAIVCCAAVFSALTALVCQVAPTVQGARLLGGAMLGLFLLLRIAADIGTGNRWIHWLTPLGWVEELRPFSNPDPLVLLLPATTTLLATVAASVIAARRDVGTAIFAERAATSNDWLLQSAAAESLRAEAPTLIAWMLGTAVFAAVIGSLVKSVAQLLQHDSSIVKTFGLSSRLITPEGFMSFYFLFFILLTSILAIAMLGAAREEEATGRLETLLAEPVSRLRWFASRLTLAFVSSGLLAFMAAIVSWAAADLRGADIALDGMLRAAANAIPIMTLFLGLTTLVFALAPRLTAGVGYGLIGVSFLWELFGPALKVPAWMLDLSPFHHVAAVPIYPFNIEAAIVMALLGLTAVGASLLLFRRRDLIQA